METWFSGNHLCIWKISGSLCAGKQYSEEARPRCRWLRGTPSPALGPVVSESAVTQSPKASREAYGARAGLAAYKWVGKMKAGPDRGAKETGSVSGC